MLGAGLEPAWGFPPGILSPLRLPISPPEPDRLNSTQDIPALDCLRLDDVPPVVTRFPAMIRRLAPVAIFLGAFSARMAAQLPLVTAPQHTVRVDLSGSFYPNERVWVDGTTRPLGLLVNGGTNAMIGTLQSGLATALGQPVSGFSIGTINVIAAREHGVGDIGLAYGLTKRITIFGSVPIVYVRSRVSPTLDATSANVGINPGHPVLGNGGALTLDTEFLMAFRDAMTELGTRIQRGDFANDPTSLALAQEALSSGNSLRSALVTLLANPVLPVAGDPSAMQLVTRISTLQTTLSGQLGDTTIFNTTPALPSAPLNSDQLDALVSSPGGFGLTFGNDLGHFALGDMAAGAAIELLQQGRVGGPSWRSAWLRLSARFPTGVAPNPSILLDQGFGSRHPAGQVDAIVELGHGRLGLRGQASYQHQFPWNGLRLITPPDQLLAPQSSLAAVRSAPGDSIAVIARPFFGFAPHLALAGFAEYWWKARNRTNYSTGQAPIAGTDIAVVDDGTAANAVVLGIGLSYVHDGRRSDGTAGLPVEAEWSIERTVTSGQGIFPYTLTSRVALRIYRPLFAH
jgi:hypothetical protein